jgi:hypothetical protein
MRSLSSRHQIQPRSMGDMKGTSSASAAIGRTAPLAASMISSVAWAMFLSPGRGMRRRWTTGRADPSAGLDSTRGKIPTALWSSR